MARFLFIYVKFADFLLEALAVHIKCFGDTAQSQNIIGNCEYHANGTNRLAIAVQRVLAVAGFKRKGVSDFRFEPCHFSVNAYKG